MKVEKIMAIAVAFALIISCVNHVTASEIEVAVNDEGNIIADDYAPLANENSDFEYNELEDGTLQLTEYKGKGGDVVIPGVIDGKIVKTICYFAFNASENANKIISVTIPSSVTNIEDNPNNGMNTPSGVTFKKCTNLTDIIVAEDNKNFSSVDGALYNKEQTTFIKCPPGKKGSFVILDGVTYIKSTAFDDCAFITSITIPDGVTRVYFSNCKSLISVFLPKSVNYISPIWSISGCDSLAEINVDKENTVYSSIDGVLYSKDQSILILYPMGKKGNYKIPDNVTNIGDYAFKDCSYLSSIDIPNSVISIGREAFCNCTAISSVTIPSGVTEIVYAAFAGCTSLSSIDLPDNLTQIADYSFAGCTSLTTFEVPSKVNTIGQNPNDVSSYDTPRGYTFLGCTALTSIIIPESTVNIGLGTFGFPPYNITIYGVPGSYAETYATENNINFNGIKSINSNGDNLGIKVFAPSAAPTSTVLIVEKISETDEYVTYDISLTADGKNVNLNGEKAVVKIPVLDEENKHEYKVYRKEANDSYTDMKAVVSGSYLVFFTDHFSEYTVTTEKLIPDTIMGDVNGDSSVNDRDSILLDRYLAEWGSEVIIAASDLNGDGKVNDQDSIILARTLAGWYD